MVHKITPPKNKKISENQWLESFLKWSLLCGDIWIFRGVSHFVSCSFCVCFFIQPFDPDANPRHVPWTMEHPKNVPFPFRSFEPKLNLKKQSSKFASSTHSSLLQWRRDNSSCHLEGSPFFFDLLLNRGIRWPQSAPDLHGFENRQEITVSSCFVCERSNQLVWCLSRTKSGDLIDPDRYSWYIYIYYQIYHSGGNTWKLTHGMFAHKTYTHCTDTRYALHPVESSSERKVCELLLLERVRVGIRWQFWKLRTR